MTVLEIIIKAKDQASAQIKGMGAKIKSSVKNLIQLPHVIAAAGITAAITKVIGAYGRQEKALAKLIQQLKNHGEGTKENIDALTAQAKALQKVTTFGDEQILAGQAMLASFNLTTKQIMDLTPRMLDLAIMSENTTGMQADLASIAKLVGVALGGQAGRLVTMGIAMTDVQKKMLAVADANEKINLLIQIFDSNAKGLAETVAKTGVGPLTQFGNKLGDITETIGKDVLPGIMDLTKSFEDLYPPLAPVIKSIIVVFSTLTIGFTTSVRMAKRFFSILIEGFITSVDLILNLLRGNFKKIPQIAKEHLDIMSKDLKEIPKIADEQSKKMSGIWTGLYVDLTKTEGKHSKESRDLTKRDIEAIDLSKRVQAKEEKSRLEKELREKEKYEEALYKYKVKIGEITLQQRIEDTEKGLKLLRERNEAETVEYVKLLERLNSLRSEQAEREEEGRIKNLDSTAEYNELLKKLNEDLTLGMQENFSTAFQEIMKGTGNTSDRIRNLYQGIANAAIKTIADILAQELIANTIKKQLAISEASSKAVAAHAGIPFVGLAIGLASAAAFAAAISKFQEGGIVTKPTLGLVGEAGPEAIIPLSKLGASPGNVSFGDININLNVEKIDREDLDDTLRRLSEAVRDETASAVELSLRTYSKGKEKEGLSIV